MKTTSRLEVVIGKRVLVLFKMPTGEQFRQINKLLGIENHVNSIDDWGKFFILVDREYGLFRFGFVINKTAWPVVVYLHPHTDIDPPELTYCPRCNTYNKLGDAHKCKPEAEQVKLKGCHPDCKGIVLVDEEVKERHSISCVHLHNLKEKHFLWHLRCTYVVMPDPRGGWSCSKCGLLLSSEEQVYVLFRPFRDG